jgi:pSer/pThr/pTyr-binding forkhead associated (FHA) protein
MEVTLRCTAGPLTGDVISVEGEILLGREVAELERLGGDARLSRRHARVFIDGAHRAVIEDLGSTNGTWVNGERVIEPRVLVTGDEIRLGETAFQVAVPERPSATVVPSASPAARAGREGADRPRLSIVAGPSRGSEIALGDELLIGRSYREPGDLGGDRRLSRRHARIARGPSGVFFIEDTGSTNGTLLNGARLRGTNPLKSEDEVGVGSSTLITHGLPEVPLLDELEESSRESFVQTSEPAVAAAVPDAAAFEPEGAAGTRLSSRRLVTAFAAVFAVATLAAAAVVLLAAPPGSRACPQGFICHRPPTAPPLQALTRFRGALGWRTEYDPQAATPATEDVAGNELILHESNAQDRSWGVSPGSQLITVLLVAFPASQASPRAALNRVRSSLESKLVGAAAAPSSDQVFARPVLGFHPAQGGVIESNLQTAQGPGALVKVAVLAASSGGVTIVAAVVYPVQRGQSQQRNPDQPFDLFGDQVLETVRFPSDGGV